jgi:hypothetical protein
MSTDRGSDGAELVKVVVDLPEDGWTGFATERLWAVRTGPTTAVLDNNPFFARGLAYGDEVRFAQDTGGELRVTDVVAHSGYCSIRIAPLDRTDEFRDLEVQAGIRAVFVPLGVTCEMAGPRLFNLVALAVPPSCDIAAVRQALLDGERDDRWSFEEGCITPQWRALSHGDPDGETDPDEPPVSPS